MKEFLLSHWDAILYPIIVLIGDHLVAKSGLKANSIIGQIWELIKKKGKK